jgi:hypothetical protein
MLTPIAKRDHLIVEEVGSETVIYDELANEAHCLDATAAFVWRRCDGKRTVDQIRAELMQSVGCSVSRPEMLELIDLIEAKGLTELRKPSDDMSSMSRRGVLRKAVLIGTVAVTIQSIVAPTPAHASSCRSAGGRRTQPRRQPQQPTPGQGTRRRRQGLLRLILQFLFRLFR